MNGSSQFCFHRDHSRMSKRHQEPILVFRELKPKCCFVLTQFQVFEVQGTEFWKPQAALGFGSSHTDSEEQCLEKCECPLCVGTVTVLSVSLWRPWELLKNLRKLTQPVPRLVFRAVMLEWFAVMLPSAAARSGGQGVGRQIRGAGQPRHLGLQGGHGRGVRGHPAALVPMAAVFAAVSVSGVCQHGGQLAGRDAGDLGHPPIIKDVPRDGVLE